MDLAQRPVSSLMQSQFVSLDAKEKLDLAAVVMQLGRIRHLPVLEEGRLVGMVSNRDVLSAGLSGALDFDPAQRRTFLRSVEAREVMAREVETIGPEDSLAEAAQRMVEHKIGCLPVVGENRVMVGILTETDLLLAAYVDRA